MRSANQPEVTLVDQIAQRDTLVLVFLGDGNNETQVRANEFVECFLVAFPDSLSELDLVFPLQQRVSTDLLQVLIERAFLVHAPAICRKAHVRLQTTEKVLAGLRDLALTAESFMTKGPTPTGRRRPISESHHRFAPTECASATGTAAVCWNRRSSK